MSRFKLLLLLSLFVTIACYPVSHVIIGDTQALLDYTNVKTYSDYPDTYEKIAIIEASSDLAFKDFSIEFTHQQKTNKALERLKKEAASLGANGIVIQAPTSHDDITFTLPASDGSSGQVLQTNGSGVLSFTDAGSGLVGSSNEKLFVEAENQMDNSFSTTANFNYVAASPMIIASGATLTVTANSTMTFV